MNRVAMWTRNGNCRRADGRTVKVIGDSWMEARQASREQAGSDGEPQRGRCHNNSFYPGVHWRTWRDDRADTPKTGFTLTLRA